MTASITDDPAPRVIAATPLAHMLILPRSLLVLSSSLYTSHLHGIRAQTKDVVHQGEGVGGSKGDLIVNADLLGNAEITDALRDGSWTGDRGVRTSLTFRTADKVLKGGGAANLLKGVMKKA
jgi:alkylated DNA repair protein alkB family protein 6